MPSERFESLLAEHLDGALDAAGREELARELERDPDAARAFDEAVRLEALLLAAHGEPPSRERLSERILRKAQAAPVLRPAQWKSRVMAAAAAAILIAAGAWAAISLANGRRTIGPEPHPAPSAGNRVVAGTVLVDGVASGEIANGAKVEVAGGKTAEIRLADGSTAWLEPESRAVLAGPVGDVRQVVELEGGKGSFKVEKEPRQFKVRTQVGSVTVTGTEFSVELLPREAKGEGQMRGKLGLALAVSVIAGAVQVDYDGRTETLTMGMSKTYGEEGEKREGVRRDGEGEKREGVLRDGESIVGKKLAVSEKPAAATFVGTVAGRERALVRIVIEKIEGQTEWTGPKGEDGKPRAVKVVVGEPLAVCAQWEKGEDGKWRPSRNEMRLLGALRRGDKVEGGIYFDEHPRMAYFTVTARTEGEVRDGEKRREGGKRDGEKKREGGGDKGDKAPEAPKSGGDEF